MDHIGSGKSWDLSRKNEGLYFLPPFGNTDELYNGRIASLSGIMPFLRNSKEEYVVLSDCHVVGNIDYDRLVEEHIASGADVTIAYKKGAPPADMENVLLWTASDGRVTDMVIRSGGPEESRYGIGLYVMGKEELMRAVDTAVSRHHGSFEWDILLRHVEDKRLYGYCVNEYVSVISSLERYFRANMALLDAEVRNELFVGSRRFIRRCGIVRPRSTDCTPRYPIPLWPTGETSRERSAIPSCSAT